MAFLGLLLLVALLIPIVGLVLDSPVGRALARRLEGPEAPAPGLADLTRRLDSLESDVEDLQRSLVSLQEETQFLQRLLQDQPGRPQLPPSRQP